MKRTKQAKQVDERRDVLIRRVDMVLWRRARVAALECGVTMAQWIEDAVRGVLARRGGAA